MKTPYIVIDIETKSLSDEALEKERQFLKPNGNLKPSKKIKDDVERQDDFEARQQESIDEQFEKLKEKSALSDQCEIGCIGVRIEGASFCFLNATIESYEIAEANESGVFIYQKDTEKDIVQMFCQNMAGLCDENTVLVGHNLGFDLSKIRLACLRNRVPLPAFLSQQQPTFDTSYTFARYFSIRQPYISLAEVAYRLGIADEGQKVVDGAEIPKMFEDGRVLEVILYNAVDLWLTENVYKFLSNQFV